MLSVANDDAARVDGRSMLGEICREGARTLLAAALEAEVNAYLAELSGERDEDGHALGPVMAAHAPTWSRASPGRSRSAPRV